MSISKSNSREKDKNMQVSSKTRRVVINSEKWSGPSQIPKFWQGSKKKLWSDYPNKDHHINEIKTSKYNIFTFLPLNLFFQFHRFANIYFLVMVILQCIPIISSVNPAGTAFPLILVLLVTMIKDGYDDFQQHRQDKYLNNKITKKIMKNGEIMPIPWKDVMTGNLLLLDKDDGVPADLVLLASHNEDGVAFLETAELDGETNLKIKTALKNTTEAIDFDDWENKDFSKLVKIVDGSFQDVELPNDRLPKFDGTFHSNSENEKISVSNDNVLLRGTILRNTPSAIGVVVYAGPDSKLMKNGGNARFKRTNMDILMNRLVILIFVILVLFAFGATIGHIVSEFDIGIRFRQFNPWDKEIVENTKIPNVPNFRWMEIEDWKSLPWTPWKSGALIFWSYTILLNTLVPISLYVSVEMIRLGQSMFINWDRGMYYEKNDTPASARSTTLNEELGQVSYIFSDKTGTLTQNIMEFKKAYIGGRIYGNGSRPVDFSWNRHHNGEFTFSDQSLVDDFRKENEHVNRFLKILALNHTVMPEYTEVDLDGIGAPASMLYQAQSPDEGALVSAARAFGFVFTNRTTDTIQVSRLDETITYELLHIADFDNDRKRMSVVVREPQTKEIIVYTKGADSTVLSNLTKSTPENIRKGTDEALTRFAEDGLRTLCLGYKKLSEAEWSAWEKKYQEAATSMEERDEKISIVHEELESKLILAGVTAIEDKLQDGVPETIKQILLAGIKLWVLTGDKLETAINIGYSCNLLANEMTNVFEVAEESSPEVLENLNTIQKELDNGHGDYGLVITGQALGYAISDHKNLLLDVSRKCKSVICCRVTPLQKAQVVQMIKEAEKCITLAIGDGANDVSMIKEAHLGIGITGLEGTQAVLASDFSFGQFRYLERLLLIHGRYSYYRMAIFLDYFLVKNFAFTFCHFWFGIFCLWSAQSVYEDMMIASYNVVYTSIPVLILAIMDKDVNERSSLKNPSLYKLGHNDSLFNMKRFWFILVRGFFISVFFFIVSYFALEEMEERSGDAMDINTFQVTMQTGIVLVMTLQMCFDTKNWTILNVSAILGSAIAYFIFSGMYYSKGAYELSIDTFKLVGVAPHVWGIVTPWLVIFLVLVIYLIFVLAWRFVQILYFKSIQDKALDQQRAEKAAIKEQKVNQSNFSRGSTRRHSKRSMHKTQSSFAFATSDKKPGQMIREGSLRVSSIHSSRMASPRMRKVPENPQNVSEAEQATHVQSIAF